MINYIYIPVCTITVHRLESPDLVLGGPFHRNSVHCLIHSKELLLCKDQSSVTVAHAYVAIQTNKAPPQWPVVMYRMVPSVCTLRYQWSDDVLTLAIIGCRFNTWLALVLSSKPFPRRFWSMVYWLYCPPNLDYSPCYCMTLESWLFSHNSEVYQTSYVYEHCW